MKSILISPENFLKMDVPGFETKSLNYSLYNGLNFLADPFNVFCDIRVSLRRVLY